MNGSEIYDNKPDGAAEQRSCATIKASGRIGRAIARAACGKSRGSSCNPLTQKQGTHRNRITPLFTCHFNIPQTVRFGHKPFVNNDIYDMIDTSFTLGTAEITSQSEKEKLT